MQKWEYQHLYIGSRFKSIILKERIVHDADVGYHINELGKAGWELVCSHVADAAAKSIWDDVQILLLFKRPKD